MALVPPLSGGMTIQNFARNPVLVNNRLSAACYRTQTLASDLAKSQILVWNTFHVKKDESARLGYLRLFYHINLVIPDSQRFEGVVVFRWLIVFPFPTSPWMVSIRKLRNREDTL